jgi:uncharacterized protein
MKNGTIRENSINEIEAYSNYFKKVWGKSKPLAKIFRTDTRGYLYDTGTNKIIGCDESICDLIEKLLSEELYNAVASHIAEFGKKKFVYAATSIKNAIDKENVLSTLKIDGFGLQEPHEYRELIDSYLETLLLEVTECCNLSCEYCVYNPMVKNKRNHGNNNMSIDIAQKAIDYLHKHSIKNKKVSLVFYGGEPLLRFHFIKSCVKYARDVLSNQKINFTITTNAVLLNPEIAEFLFKNDFTVFVSIDGPKEIHNSFRINKKGEGSFTGSIGGLKNIVHTYGEQAKEKIRLSMVYTPPFSNNRINRIAELWNEITWLPKELGVEISYPSPGTIPAEKIQGKNHEEDKDLRQWAYEKFKGSCSGKEGPHPIANSIMEKDLAHLMQRPIYPQPGDRYSLNGCCIPGVEKLFVSTNGTFRVCEKIATDAPAIGNVLTGIEFSTIMKSYLDEYEKMCRTKCSDCWALRLCSLCYDHALNNGKLDINTRSKNCMFEKKMKERTLVYFCLLMERDSQCLDYLYKLDLRSGNDR